MMIDSEDSLNGLRALAETPKLRELLRRLVS